MNHFPGLVAAALMTIGAAWPQQVKSPSISVLKSVSDDLFLWINSLSNGANQLADKEDERRLKDSFKTLDKDIYSVEENGRKLVSRLEAKPLDQAAARTAVKDTGDALKTLKDQLHATGLALRSQYRQGGADTEKLISDAIDAREGFLADVQAEIASGHISDRVINAGRATLNIQRTASEALIQVIDKMP